MTQAGTGKTYASAFALRELLDKYEKEKKRKCRALFLVHREQIAKQAMSSYKNVFGSNRTFGILSGNEKNYDTDFLFSTMQMMAKDETLERIKKTEFDIIVIDEVHRTVPMGLIFMDYFTIRLHMRFVYSRRWRKNYFARSIILELQIWK